MHATNVLTGATMTTHYIRQVRWRGQRVTVDAETPCVHPQGLWVMHHGNDPEHRGRHWCPTGWLYCPDCMGLAEEPPPYTCTRWGE